MKLLFIGDIVGRPGRMVTKDLLPKLKQKYSPDIIMANGENSAAGVGITKKVYNELLGYGINVLTMGNHIWDRKEFLPDINSCPNIIRPANYPEGIPGEGFKVFQIAGFKFGVINLLGRIFMGCTDDPFRIANEIIKKMSLETKIIIIDFHGEATSEKNAFAWYIDGKASVVLGTHTHIQTSDERILPGGTSFISDVGMVGAYDSVIGVQKEQIIKRFLTAIPEHFEPEKKGPGVFNGVFVDIDENGKTRKIERILEIVEDMEDLNQIDS
jgi:2',3'-cyclic-nucleotide 2'-phosphodiesterase